VQRQELEALKRKATELEFQARCPCCGVLMTDCGSHQTAELSHEYWRTLEQIVNVNANIPTLPPAEVRG
jgi:hypothetical protein